MAERSGTSLALGIGLLMAAAVIVDAVFTGRHPWDIVLAVTRGETTPPKAQPGSGSGAPSTTATGSVQPTSGFIGGAIANVKANLAVTYALAQVGKDYSLSQRFGPNSFDCSGLTFMAAKAAGAVIGGTSYEQATQGKTIIASPQYVQAGDLLFYYGDSPARNLGHVAMAISSTQQVAAPHTGAKVQIQPIRFGNDPHADVQLVKRVF